MFRKVLFALLTVAFLLGVSGCGIDTACSQTSDDDVGYGPGTSYLQLEAGEDTMAAFRLVRANGSEKEEFFIKLNAGQSREMSFPCGLYVLKTAEGETWISDKVAFGSEGIYSTTDAYLFEADMEYYITSGTTGDFRNDSYSGFTE